VTSFGIDNGLLLCGAPAVMSTLSGWKPFDFTLSNFFYHLQGEKFSTSRRHVIWTVDIIEKTPANSDALRYFLARENPENKPTNFDVHQFVRCVNDVLIGKIQSATFEALRSLDSLDVREASPESHRMLGHFLRDQEKAFSLGSFSLAKIPRIVESWIDAMSTNILTHRNEAYLWLKGLAFLAAPLMPRFASCLWQALGHKGEPLRSELLTPRLPCGWQGRVPFDLLSVEALAPCLPEHLTLARPA
jgi:methionyl-tRNA synthetase